MVVVTVFVAESLETATINALWSTIVPILELLSVLVPFELFVVNSALM